eukprot:14581877-Ditylum_brightwellii.AAC.1
MVSDGMKHFYSPLQGAMPRQRERLPNSTFFYSALRCIEYPSFGGGVLNTIKYPPFGGYGYTFYVEYTPFGGYEYTFYAALPRR